VLKDLKIFEKTYELILWLYLEKDDFWKTKIPFSGK